MLPDVVRLWFAVNKYIFIFTRKTSKSLSKSDGDIFGKADKIAQELMDLILAEYKGDNQYQVSNKKIVIDEDDFKDKFPYTLDRQEPEKEIRPPQPVQI